MTKIEQQLEQIREVLEQLLVEVQQIRKKIVEKN